MKPKSLRRNALLMALASVMVVVVGCKKDSSPNDSKPPFTQMPDSVMFVSTLDTAKTIYALNATTGSVVTKYHYFKQPNTTWCYPAAGNSFLYSLENDKINAINMNTGIVLWTDTVNNFTVPVLHDHTFYGVSQVNTTSYNVYALDATKPSKTYLWKYEATGTPSDIRYYNGTLFVLTDNLHLAALDANSGSLKWNINNGPYSLTTINNGVILAGNTIINAVTGNTIASVTPPVIPPTYPKESDVSSLEYASQEQYYVSTTHINSDQYTATKFISAINKATGTDKWLFTYDGGWSTSYGITNSIYQEWNKQLIIKNETNRADKIHIITDESFWILDVNTGTVKLNFDDANTGSTAESYIVNNTMYFYKVSNITYTYNVSNSLLLAIDLQTGKRHWINDKLLNADGGTSATCVFAGGKGFSPYIQ